MKLYYRISDKSYSKEKLIGTSKEICLMNFCRAFAPIIFGSKARPPEEDFQSPVKVLCDNCERTTIKMVASSGLPYTISAEGNAGSLRLAIKTALEECDNDEIVYFCEDDYLHRSSALKLLEEGLQRSEYVTLYDHPDKYTRYYNGGEFSKVIKTVSSHWRFTASTCMTFGSKIKTLREDEDVWMDKDLTGGDHPHDHHIFSRLTERNRRLAVCIPGVACHVDLSFSGLVNYMLMEPWAVEMMIQELEDQLAVIFDELSADRKEEYIIMQASLLWSDKNVKEGLEKLMALDAMRFHFS